MKQKIENTLIFGDDSFGLKKLPKRTPWKIIKATLWLWYFSVRLWLAEHGLFVKKIHIEMKND